MAPSSPLIDHQAMSPRGLEGNPGLWRDRATAQVLIVESWSQGFLVAALLIMACITIANMRAGIFLHKLILLEVSLERKHAIPIPNVLASFSLQCRTGHSASPASRGTGGTYLQLQHYYISHGLYTIWWLG
jgi:hypothetical protein